MRSFLISLDFSRALEAPQHTGAPQQPSCLIELLLYNPRCPMCLVDGLAAHSQVCRPPESLLMDLRWGWDVEYWWSWGETSWIPVDFPCRMHRSLGDLPGFLPLCSRVGGRRILNLLDCSTSPHSFSNACRGPHRSFSFCFLISILPPPNSFYSWPWPTHASTVLEWGSLTREHLQVCSCSMFCVSCFLFEWWYGNTFFWCSWNVSISMFLGHLSLLSFAGNGT